MDKSVFNEVVLPQYNYLLSLAKRMTRDPMEAEDFVQSAMLRAFKNFEQYNGECNIRTWLYRLITNHVSYIKRPRILNERRLPEEIVGEIVDRHTYSSYSDDFKVIVDRLRMELRGQLLQVFDMMVDDKSISEIATSLNIPKRAVSAAIHRIGIVLRPLAAEMK